MNLKKKPFKCLNNQKITVQSPFEAQARFVSNTNGSITLEVSKSVPGVLQYIISAEATVFNSRGRLFFFVCIQKSQFSNS